VQRIIVGSNKATEKQLTIKFVQITEHVESSDHFIHRHLHKLTIWLLWYECAADILSRIAYRLLLVASVRILPKKKTKETMKRGFWGRYLPTP
jgi:hypothetical protein